MDAHLADLQSAEDKVVKIVAIAAKVAGAMADDSVPQEELAKDAEEYVDLAKASARREAFAAVAF